MKEARLKKALLCIVCIRSIVTQSGQRATVKQSISPGEKELLNCLLSSSFVLSPSFSPSNPLSVRGQVQETLIH